MVKFFDGVESEPRLIVLSQIEVSQESSASSKADVKKNSHALKEQKHNVSLPLVCLTEDEDRYQLLTGLPIFEAAKVAELTRIWVFLIATTKPDASQIIDQVLLQSKLNQPVFDLEDIQKFVDFINESEESELTKISGVKEKYAKLIQSKRPFQSPEDIKRLGAKRSVQWLQAYTRQKL